MTLVASAFRRTRGRLKPATTSYETSSTHPDVIVVGAGPAGATAARALALGGARVQLLERYRFPRAGG